jgi:diguanylate cyclase (GGDEF)-like protein
VRQPNTGKDSKRLNYKRQFVKRDRAVKILKELSEFLKILDMRESNILHTMIVRFAIESVEASLGSLLVYDNERNVLRYQDTYRYENNKIILENYGELLHDIFIRPGEGIVGESYIKAISILVDDMSQKDYEKPLISDIVKVEIKSVIAMPLQVDNEVVSVLEIANTSDKEPFTMDDVEIITIIANFASTILDNARLFSWAIHDSLTNLYNNHYFYKELSDEVERSKRYGRVFSLVFFDVDDFKHINDGYGHSAGDKALQLLAECINKTIRKEVDIAARYGGDEFVIVLPNTAAPEAFKVSARLATLVKNSSVVSSDGRELKISLSMGIAEFPKDGEETYILFNNADESLYASKGAGKDAICIYGEKPKKPDGTRAVPKTPAKTR